MKVTVTVCAQDDQVALPLKTDALVRSVMHFEPVIVRAEVAGVSGLLKRQQPDTLPMICAQVEVVRQLAQRQNRLLDRPIDFVQCHGVPSLSSLP